jgi:hypothetical protein
MGNLDFILMSFNVQIQRKLSVLLDLILRKYNAPRRVDDSASAGFVLLNLRYTYA